MTATAYEAIERDLKKIVGRDDNSDTDFQGEVNVECLTHRKWREHRSPQDAERQASAGARDGVKGKGAISLRALRCMR